MGLLVIVLIGLAAFTVWSAVKTHAPCRWCKGSAMSRSLKHRRSRIPHFCTHCGGTGMRMKYSSRIIHRGIHSGIRQLQNRGDQ